MMFHKKIGTVSTIFLLSTLFSVIQSLACVKFVSFSPDDEHMEKSPRVLLIRAIKHWGGVEKHTFALYKELYALGCSVRILVPSGSKIQAELIKARLPHYVARLKRCRSKHAKRQTFQTNLVAAIERICRREKIDVVHANKPLEVSVALGLANKFKFAVIAQHHVFLAPTNLDALCNVDAFLSTSPNVIKEFQVKNMRCSLGVKNVEFIPPMVLSEQFLKLAPIYPNRRDFFEKMFNVDVGNLPVVCMVAHLYKCKNHELLLHAADILINQIGVPVHIVLAGGDSDCPGRAAELKSLVAKLGLQDYVHLLGPVNNIPELLYCSDIKVLTSTGEAFAIAVLEAALMKKPIILSRAAGAVDQIVFDGKTGLLFNPTDAMELALHIKTLIDDRIFAKKLGEKAYELAVEKFSDVAIAKRYLAVYNKVYSQKKKAKVLQ
jgi:glycosyltransferase involved in cell wall biosynthesis